MYGNIFSLDFSSYGFLATDTMWFKLLWVSSCYHNVDILMREDFQLHPFCESDRPLIECFTDNGVDTESLGRLSRLARSNNILHLSDTMESSGIHIGMSMLGISNIISLMTFPHEQPA